MELIDELEEEIDKLKDNEYGLKVIKNKYRGIITTSIIIPQDIINKEISEMTIEFQLIIDTNSLKLMPKLYCVSPFCFPHFADGRDLFNELRSSKNPQKNYWLENLLSDILEFIKINFEKGGLYFCGNYYLGTKYDLRLLQKGCETILNVRENLVINGKNLKINRVLVLSDVYFLLFEQEKWYKNNLTLLFWSSISNIQKIQKVKDSRTIILQWTQKEKETYPMSLTLPQRDIFIENLLEKMHHFGMVYDVTKMDNTNKNKNIAKKKLKKIDDISESQNVKLINDYNKQDLEKNKNNEEEEEEEYEEEEEEEDDVEEDEHNKDKEKKNVIIDVKKDNKEKNIDNENNNNQKGQNEDNKGKNKEQNKNENQDKKEEQKEEGDDDEFIEVSNNEDKKEKDNKNENNKQKQDEKMRDKEETKQEDNINVKEKEEEKNDG